MTDHLGQKNKGEDQREGLVEEGTLHTGVAMQGLAKLPKMHGKVYRGARLTPEDFAREYAVGKTVTFPSLTSASTELDVAEGFARGEKTDDKTVHYVVTLNATNARDIRLLALLENEKEWVLLPGATFVVKTVKKVDKELADGHEWYEIELQQTK
jgi:hypothetical protein